ncbi:MAG: hypothetical protein A3I00_05825 [Betaproteobacteria bacterium RIFCSPLOWO2_02_FULL_64_12]|nr:MAG: hypothetical protein A3I00_05825 [Betaproteobacteria bacterium RIFCSPLOWO2_02_FULL_64_12]
MKTKPADGPLPLLTLGEAARRLDLSNSGARERVRRGALRAAFVTSKRALLFTPSEVERAAREERRP